MATLDDLAKILDPIAPADLTDIVAQLQADLALSRANDNLAQLIASRDEMLTEMQTTIVSAQTSLAVAKQAQAAIKP